MSRKKTYPCIRKGCKVRRTEEEGGRIFTVCDKHWDEKYKKKVGRNKRKLEVTR